MGVYYTLIITGNFACGLPGLAAVVISPGRAPSRRSGLGVPSSCAAVSSAALPEPSPLPCLMPLFQDGFLHMASRNGALRHYRMSDLCFCRQSAPETADTCNHAVTDLNGESWHRASIHYAPVISRTRCCASLEDVCGQRSRGSCCLGRIQVCGSR